jgi:A/G-specific adenine glycosylase
MTVDASNALLRWYIVDKRSLPWRAVGKERPDPYRVWLSEIMLQQTTVAAVRPYFEKFTGRWPTVAALASADEAEVMSAWAGLGYYARARNLVACARAVAAAGGAFPDDEAELLKLPGIGRYTAAAIAAIAFQKRAVVVDSNVERVVSRLFAVKRERPAAREEMYGLAAGITPDRHCGDFAQAMMDLGATICTPRDPSCHICPLAEQCAAREEGQPRLYPLKAAKSRRPHKQGNAFWLQNDGHVLLVRRPAKGMLGGMLGLPTGEWGQGVAPSEGAPAAADWQEAGAVDHVFTHFALNMRLYCAEAPARNAEGSWWPVERISEAGLPTLFAKLAERGAAWQNAE